MINFNSNNEEVCTDDGGGLPPRWGSYRPSDDEIFDSDQPMKQGVNTQLITIPKSPFDLMRMSDELATASNQIDEELEEQIRGMRRNNYPEEDCRIIMASKAVKSGVDQTILNELIARIYEEKIAEPGITDVELANYCLSECRHAVAFMKDTGVWFIWDGKTWEQDQSNAVLEHKVLPILLTVPNHITDTVLQEKAKIKVNTSSTVTKVITSMRRKIEPIRCDMLDANPFLLNCRNGVLDLNTPIRFRKAKSSDYLTKFANVEYDMEATCPKFEKFLNQIMLGDEQSVRLVQVLIGYILLGGDNKERLMFWLIGGGKNGKSTLIRVLMELMGTYATSIVMSTLLKGNDSGPRDDLMSLASYRLLTINEFDKDDKLAVRTAKAMTGNDVMKARDLYSKYKDIQINGTILVSTNEMPRLSEDSSEAFWDRIRILPFKLRVKEEDENTTMIDELKKELPGILNFALEGLKLYSENRMLLREETPLMIEAKKNYRITIKSNVIREFINWNYERCDPKSGKTKSIEITDSFNQWAKDNRIAVSLTAQKLKKEMLDLGIPENATGGRYYCCVSRNNTETEIKTETELLNGEVK